VRRESSSKRLRREGDLHTPLSGGALVGGQVTEQTERVGLAGLVAGLLERTTRRLGLLSRLFQLADVAEGLRTPVCVLGCGGAGHAPVEQLEVLQAWPWCRDREPMRPR
jgi:hypothetical protein